MEKRIGSIQELEAEAAAFVAGLSPQEDKATLVTLSGELGAGKTAFTKAVAKVLGVTVDLTSPTFVLQKAYDISYNGFSRLIHIDAYRLESGEELAPLRLDESLEDPKNLIMLEWPEKVVGALPAAAISIAIEPNADGSRTMRYA